MGARLVKFEFCPKENEQIEATVKVPEENRSVIHGTVINCKNIPIKDAVVKLFEKIKTSCGSKLIPITHTFTDNCGEFLFGPLHPNKEYALKVWYHDVNIRKIKFNSENCDDQNDYDDYNSYDYCDKISDDSYTNCGNNIEEDHCSQDYLLEDTHCDHHEVDDCCNSNYEEENICYHHEADTNCDDYEHHGNHNDCEDNVECDHHHDDDDDDDKENCYFPVKKSDSCHTSDDD